MRRHGFTLIELLVVVAIISLLVSILLPSLSRAKELARTVVCATNIHNWFPIVAMYSDESNGDYPVTGLLGGGGTNYLFNYIPTATGEALAPYCAEESLLGLMDCPSNEYVDPMWPDYEHASRIRSQYQFMLNILDCTATWHNGQQNLRNAEKTVGAPTDVGIISDWNVYLVGMDWDIGYTNHFETSWRASSDDEEPDCRGLNVLFADGHVAWADKGRMEINAEAGADPGRFLNYWW